MDVSRAEGLIDIIYDYIERNLELVVFDFLDDILDLLVKQHLEATLSRVMSTRDSRQEVIDYLTDKGYKVEYKEIADDF